MILAGKAYCWDANGNGQMGTAAPRKAWCRSP
jgi:hypothetical protein